MALVYGVSAKAQTILELVGEYLCANSLTQLSAKTDGVCAVRECFQVKNEMVYFHDLVRCATGLNMARATDKLHELTLNEQVRDLVYVFALDNALELGERHSQGDIHAEGELYEMLYHIENILQEYNLWEYLDDEEQTGIRDIVITVFKYAN